MQYSEIISTALAYADRTDNSVSSKVDMFLKIAESRINRYLTTQDMVLTSNTPIVADAFLYALPSDFLMLRGISIKNNSDPKTSYQLSYVTPKLIEDIISIGISSSSYTMIGNSIKIASLPDTTDPTNNWVLEIDYYKNVPALTSVNNENWLSILSPDTYVFGLMTEISAFVKDKDSAALWDTRFKNALDELNSQDDLHLWAGPSINTMPG